MGGPGEDPRPDWILGEVQKYRKYLTVKPEERWERTARGALRPLPHETLSSADEAAEIDK